MTYFRQKDFGKTTYFCQKDFGKTYFLCSFAPQLGNKNIISSART